MKNIQGSAHINGDLGAWLQTVLTKLRQEFARRLKEQRQQFPNMKMPCETCAFRTSTDSWHGFDQTAVNFLGALIQREPFYCHHDMPQYKNGEWHPPTKRVNGKTTIDFSRMHLCSAWAVLFTANPPLDISEYIPIEELRTCIVQIANNHALEVVPKRARR